MTGHEGASAQNHSKKKHSGHGHSDGVIDPRLAATERGIWALKWSFVGLFVTALFQVVVVYYSGSVAFLADTIHKRPNHSQNEGKHQ